MPTHRFDVAIVGLGAMGAATAWRSALHGARVVGFDRFRPPHALGSTHGRSRIIREAYYEHPLYVPIVQRSYALWAQLEEEAHVRLFQACGGLMVGAPDAGLIRGARDSATRHGLPVQEWSRADIRARVPGLTPSPGMIGLFESRAGVLDPERGVTALLGRAEARGADLRMDTAVTRWRASVDGVTIETGTGDIVEADRLVLAAGGWLTDLAPELALPLTVERAVQFWFPTGDNPRFKPDRFPVFLLETADEQLLYGLPDQGHGLKLAEHHAGEVSHVDAVRRDVTRQEIADFRDFVAPYVADLAEPVDTAVCFYTNTPDGHFLLDRHPHHPQVYLLSACSGHGFKFAPALGEIVVKELAGHEAGIDLAPFRLARLFQ